MNVIRKLDPGEAELFRRVVVGVDGTEPGLEACRQAVRLLAPGGELQVVSVVDRASAARAGFAASLIADELERDATEALAEAQDVVGPDALLRLSYGKPGATLLDELARTNATLAVVGTHGHGRASEIVIGGVAGELLHSAPCSVLIARPKTVDGAFPGSIVVGLDGSQESEAALGVAEELAGRFDATLRAVIALEDDSVDVAAARAAAPSLEELDGRPVEVLSRVAESTDLLVVGSRGLRGLRALGSVSERVAHEAPSSVLVVRGRGA